RLWLENSQATPISTASPNRPKPMRDRTSIQIPRARTTRHQTPQITGAGPHTATCVAESAVAGNHPVAALELRLAQAAVSAPQQARQRRAVNRAGGDPGAEAHVHPCIPAPGDEGTRCQLPAYGIDPLPGSAAGLRHDQQQLVA